MNKGRAIYQIKNTPVEPVDALERAAFNEHLRQLLVRLQVNLVLDVGANTGQYAMSLRGVGYEGRIASFEPITELADLLMKQSRNDPEWTIHPIALGRENRRGRLNVTQNPLFASFLQPNAACRQFFGNDGRVCDSREVDRYRLDSVLGPIVEGLESPRVFLKMDTQGYDTEVFSGLGAHVECVVALQSELPIIPIYEDMSTMSQALDLYCSHGFWITGIFPVNRDAIGRLIEIDCLMLRSARPPPTKNV